MSSSSVILNEDLGPDMPLRPRQDLWAPVGPAIPFLDVTDMLKDN